MPQSKSSKHSSKSKRRGDDRKKSRKSRKNKGSKSKNLEFHQKVAEALAEVKSTGQFVCFEIKKGKDGDPEPFIKKLSSKTMQSKLKKTDEFIYELKSRVCGKESDIKELREYDDDLEEKEGDDKRIGIPKRPSNEIVIDSLQKYEDNLESINKIIKDAEANTKNNKSEDVEVIDHFAKIIDDLVESKDANRIQIGYAGYRKGDNGKSHPNYGSHNPPELEWSISTVSSSRNRKPHINLKKKDDKKKKHKSDMSVADEDTERSEDKSEDDEKTEDESESSTSESESKDESRSDSEREDKKNKNKKRFNKKKLSGKRKQKDSDESDEDSESESKEDSEEDVRRKDKKKDKKDEKKFDRRKEQEKDKDEGKKAPVAPSSSTSAGRRNGGRGSDEERPASRTTSPRSPRSQGSAGSNRGRNGGKLSQDNDATTAKARPGNRRLGSRGEDESMGDER